MSRINNFKALRQHAWYKNLFNKLSDKELIFCETFIEQTNSLDLQSYLDKVRDLKYDSKNVLIINELLLVSKG